MNDYILAMQDGDFQINGAIFRQRREEQRLSLRDIADKTGVSHATVGNLETNKNVPDGLNLLKLMFFFNLSKEDIALR